MVRLESFCGVSNYSFANIGVNRNQLSTFWQLSQSSEHPPLEYAFVLCLGASTISTMPHGISSFKGSPPKM